MEYGNERTPDDNEKTIEEADADKAEKLKEYEKFAVLNIDNTIL